jgi:ATP-binding protein involved in chromosome partitioning
MTQSPVIPSLAHIPQRIAIASGKGGVGKSTVAINLALAFKEKGLAVGVFDADIYGPSLPRLLGLTGQKPSFENGKIQPLERYGLKCISMGMLVEEDAPLVWRGPMVGRAIQQLLGDVNWGGLDMLLIDMPPGTGDAQLTLAQKAGLTGAIIVSTPQDLALIDARKGLMTFQKTGVPVMGIIENMSFFACPHCGERTEIFSHGGARAEAAKLGVSFLGEIPLHAAIREASDNGEPIVTNALQSDVSESYRAIAREVLANIRA